MKLFYSPFHIFIHKVLVTAHEAGLWDDITFVPTYPFKNRLGEDQGDKYSLFDINPLSKVPTLVLDDGQLVCSSQSICECLDGMGTSANKLYPTAGTERWEAVTRLAIADTMFESTVMLVMEGWYSKEHQRIELFEWIWPKLIAGCDKFEAYCKRGFNQFDIGHAAMLHAISFIGFHIAYSETKDPLQPNFDCFENRPNLKAWWDEAIQRPSVQSHYNIDFAGDDSLDFFRENVEEVLELQRKYGTL